MGSPKVGCDGATFTFTGDKRSRTKIFENIMAANHPNLMKTVHTHPQSYTNFKKDKFKPTPAVSCKMKTKKKKS